MKFQSLAVNMSHLSTVICLVLRCSIAAIIAKDIVTKIAMELIARFKLKESLIAVTLLIWTVGSQCPQVNAIRTATLYYHADILVQVSAKIASPKESTLNV